MDGRVAGAYLSSFGQGVPDPRSLQLPSQLISKEFTVGLGSIPQSNLDAATKILSPIAQIGAQAKADKDYLQMQQNFARRNDRLRLAGALLDSLDIGGTNALAAIAQSQDPRQALVTELNFQDFLRSKAASATAESRALAVAGLQRLGRSQ